MGEGHGEEGRGREKREGRGDEGEIVIFNIHVVDRLKHSFSFGVNNALESK